MYSPRCFPYLRPSLPAPPPAKSHKRGSKPTSGDPCPQGSPLPHQLLHNMHQSTHLDASPPPPTSTAMLAHSKPVVIPPRSAPRSPPSPSSRTRTHQKHDPNAIPPALAALLAITAIPKMPLRRACRPPLSDRVISMDELIQEWKQAEAETPSAIVASPLDLLLGRLDESEDDVASLHSLDQEKASLAMSRSVSTDSIGTMPPSLEFEHQSYLSQWEPSSPRESFIRRTSAERKERLVSSPPPEDCVLDHPLLHFGTAESECEIILNPPVDVLVESIATATPRFRSLKSNLTASIQALKSAATSFSNFTAPSVPPDDFLTRSFLSPSFTSEMRPRHLEFLPSPQLRRYLNPSQPPISPTELSMHLHDSLTLDIDNDAHAPMIPMQTYERRRHCAKRTPSRLPDPLFEAGKAAMLNEPAMRQREPRENANFLRVIVLEMNMRRAGKLDARSAGRARIWLPPRKMSGTKDVGADKENEGVPARWKGVVVS